MLPFRRVLFPVDYSEPGTAALPYVRDLIEHFRADLTVVHAYGSELLAYMDYPMMSGVMGPAGTIPTAVPGSTAPQEALTSERKRLEQFAARNFPDLKVQCIVEPGDPGSVIEEVVRTQGTDLVVLPTQGHGRLRRLLLGSVTAKVLHDISAAVWTSVGDELEKHTPRVPYRSILCAVDGGEETEAVITAADALAKSYNAKLTILNVVDIPHMTFEIDFSAIVKDVTNAADQVLRETKAKLGVEAAHRIRQGNVVERIRETAEELQVDLLITGRGHMQGTVSRLWTHLYSIVRHSPCPVISI